MCGMRVGRSGGQRWQGNSQCGRGSEEDAVTCVKMHITCDTQPLGNPVVDDNRRTADTLSFDQPSHPSPAGWCRRRRTPPPGTKWRLGRSAQFRGPPCRWMWPTGTEGAWRRWESTSR